MGNKVKSNALYEDVVAVPEDRIVEIVEGDRYLSPRASLRHSNVISVLGADLIDAFHRGRRGPGGWRILVQPELHLLGDVLVPDLAGWRWERLPELPDASGVDIAPDWVCEVLSPSSERFDRRQKLPRYALAGVIHLWLVDPIRRSLEVYGRDEAGWIRLEHDSGDTVVSAPPFEAAAVDLGPLWV